MKCHFFDSEGPHIGRSFRRHLGKCSFAARNQRDDIYVNAGTQQDNIKYTDLHEWFSTMKPIERSKTISAFQKANEQEVLCASLPFLDSLEDPLPAPYQVGENWVMYLDLASRLACYLLGPHTVKEFAQRVSKEQRAKIPNG